MEFLKCRDVRWNGPKKRNKPDVLATTANHPDERSQISRYSWMQPTYMRSVSFWGKFTSGSRISASRSDLLKVPNKSFNATVIIIIIIIILLFFFIFAFSMVNLAITVIYIQGSMYDYKKRFPFFTSPKMISFIC